MADKEDGILRIHVYELRVGMCVSRLEAPTADSPFLLDRIVIESHADIQAIRRFVIMSISMSNTKSPSPGRFPPEIPKRVNI